MGRPFGRAIELAALIAATLAQTSNPATALAGIPAYVSRGKGRGLRSTSRHCVAHDQRVALQARNRKRHRKACK